VVLAIEVLSWTLWFVVDGSAFSYRRIVEAQELAIEGPFTEAPAPALNKKGKKKRRKQGVLGPLSVHPYLGFVYDPNMIGKKFKEHEGFGINQYGFVDEGSPLHKRSPDKLIVAIIGGSVAYYTSVFADEALEQALKEVAGGRRIEVVRLALGGWKQPQQLLAVSWLLSLGAEFDVVLNIDGFNEVALPWLENGQHGVFPGFPRVWMVQTRGLPSNTEKRLLSRALLANEQRASWAQHFAHSAARYSPTAQMIWRIRDGFMVKELSTAFQALQSWTPDELHYTATGPGIPDGMSEENMYVEFAANWRRSSVQLARLCAANGIRYLHFLQANQYVEGSKPMDETERQKVINLEHPYRAGVLRGYPLLYSEGQNLRKEGVEYHDLTMIFSEEHEPMYMDDCCHYTEEGNRRFIKRVAELLAESIRRSGG